MLEPRTYVSVHGINTKGKNNTDRFCMELAARGHRVVDPPLKKRHTWNVRRTLHDDARFLAGWIARQPRPVSLICHSHGCNIGLAAAMAVPVDSIYLFNAATEPDYDFGGVQCDLDRIYAIFSEDDWTVKLGNLLPFNHPFGDAGARGFDNLPGLNNRPTHGPHSRAFTEPQLSFWVDFVDRTDRQSLEYDLMQNIPTLTDRL